MLLGSLLAVGSRQIQSKGRGEEYDTSTSARASISPKGDNDKEETEKVYSKGIPHFQLSPPMPA